ncbi:hypothetical protein ACIRPK_34605 [Kitasatospora sp. NPDC101801]|uniref:hypothetical protein n=1 Tax=Kitasatospora sp. NPDC101801 TaxID=3364103 RepID=UPI00382B204E
MEFDVPEQVESWQSAEAGPGSVTGADNDSEQVTFTGTVVEIGVADDPVVSIRVGGDILLIEMSEQRFRLTVGESIAITTAAVELYPYDL